MIKEEVTEGLEGHPGREMLTALQDHEKGFKVTWKEWLKFDVSECDGDIFNHAVSKIAHDTDEKLKISVDYIRLGHL